MKPSKFHLTVQHLASNVLTQTSDCEDARGFVTTCANAFTPLPGPVYVRRLDTLETRPLEVTKSPGFRGAPVFSPDGTSISFVGGNAIFSWTRPFLKAALAGGAPVTLADYDMFHQGDWGADGWIYWTASYPGGIVRIRDSGGTIEPVTTLDVQNGERSHRFARLLPGEQALIYTVAFDGISSYDDARIDVWDLNTREKKTLIAGGTSPFYSPSGHIVYARAGKLFAVPFDIETRTITGDAVRSSGRRHDEPKHRRGALQPVGPR